MTKKLRLRDARYPGARISPEDGDEILYGMLYGLNAHQLAELTDAHWRNIQKRISETAQRLNNSTVFIRRLLGEQAYGQLYRENKASVPWIETYVQRDGSFLSDIAYCMFECPSKVDDTAARLISLERTSPYRPVQPYARFVLKAIAEDTNEIDRIWFEENPDEYFNRVYKRGMVKLNCRRCRVCTACGVASDGKDWHHSVATEVVSFQGYLTDYKRTAKTKIEEYFLAYMIAYFSFSIFPLFQHYVEKGTDAVFGDVVLQDFNPENPEGMFAEYVRLVDYFKQRMDEHLVLQVETGIMDDIKRPEALKSRMVWLKRNWEWQRSPEGQEVGKKRIEEAKAKLKKP